MLITTIDELKAKVPTIVGNDFAIYATFVSEAEHYLQVDILGKTLYDDLVSKKTNNAYAVLLDHSRRVVALKAYHSAIPFLDVVQTNTGFAVTQNANLAPASKDRVRALRDGVMMSWYNSIENLLRYLDANKSTFAGWASSPSYTTRYDLLVSSAREMNRFVPIAESHRLYLTMIPNLRYAEDKDFHPLLSKELIDDIKSKVKAGTTLSAPYKAIYTDLQAAESNLAMAYAVERQAVVVDPDGVHLNYTNGQSSFADANRTAVLADDYLARGKYYLFKAHAYILAHLTDFALFTASEAYANQSAGTFFENSEDDAIFVGGV